MLKKKKNFLKSRLSKEEGRGSRKRVYFSFLEAFSKKAMNFSLRRELSVRCECKNYQGGWGVSIPKVFGNVSETYQAIYIMNICLETGRIKCTAAQGCAQKLHQKCVSSVGERGGPRSLCSQENLGLCRGVSVSLLQEEGQVNSARDSAKILPSLWQVGCLPGAAPHILAPNWAF